MSFIIALEPDIYQPGDRPEPGGAVVRRVAISRVCGRVTRSGEVSDTGEEVHVHEVSNRRRFALARALRFRENLLGSAL